MKINAKFAALAGAAVLMGAGAFAQATDDYNLPQGFSFSNEIGSDVIYNLGNIHSDADADFNYASELAGIYDKVYISYNSEKFWFELAPKWGLRDNNENLFNSHVAGSDNKLQKSTISHADLNADDLSFSWWGLDWGVRFTPFDIVDFYLHNNVWTKGSYLPIRDEHMSNGNLAGDGVSVIFKPIDGLRLAADVPFGINYVSNPNFLNAEYNDSQNPAKYTSGVPTNSSSVTGDYKFRVDVAADYTLGDMITVGASATHLVSRADRGYGLYANINLGSLDINAGYTYKGSAIDVFDMFGIVQVGGNHVANLSAMFNAGDLSFGLETLFNAKKNESLYDLYAGLHVGYDLVPGKFNMFLNLGGAMDMGSNGLHSAMVKGFGGSLNDNSLNQKLYMSDAKFADGKTFKAAWAVKVQPGFKYYTGRNEFGAKANLLYILDGDGEYACSFPVYWKFNF